MTKAGYVEAVLQAFRACEEEQLDITVRFILAIDRRHPPSVAMDTVRLAAQYMYSQHCLWLY